MTRNTRGLLPRGAKGNKGGTGRPREEFVAKCRSIASDPRALEFFRKVIVGEPVESKIVWNAVDQKNEVKMVPASIEERRKVWESLANRGFGMPVQEIEAGDNTPYSIVVKIDSDKIQNGKDARN